MTDIILVTGGRAFGHYNSGCPETDFKRARKKQLHFIYSYWEELLKSLEHTFELVHGCATGVDRSSGTWALTNNIKVHEFPAKWFKEDGGYDQGAGLRRNEQMRDYVLNRSRGGHSKLCLISFPGNAGTRHMTFICEQASIEVIKVVYPDKII